MADGTLIFDTGIDDSGFTSDAKQLKTTATTLDSSVGNIIKGIIGVDLIQKAGSALLDFGTQSIATASNLQEVQNVLDVTFGDASETINQWSLTAKEQYGLTELQAKQFTSTMGAMLKSSGLDDSAVVQMSTSLSGLAADMASFYNLDFDTAFEKLQSGISGETEPLKELGINMSVANLEAFALAEGIEKTYTEMSQAEQTTLRYNYLMQATADAQGDFARTSDSYANQVRLLETNWESLVGSVGEALLPLATSAVTAINGIFEAFDTEIDLSSTFEDIETQLDETILAIETKKSTVETLVNSLGQFDYDVSADGTWSPSENMTELEVAQWNQILATLVETIPELTTLIDTQNGTIKGGTEAILAHAEAWETEAKAQATQLALQEKYNALGVMKLEIAEDQVDYDLLYAQWINARDERNEALQNLVNELNANGFNISTSDFIDSDGTYNGADLGTYGVTQELIALAQGYNNANTAALDFGISAFNLEQKINANTDTLNEKTAEVDALAIALAETTFAGEDLGASQWDPTVDVNDKATGIFAAIEAQGTALAKQTYTATVDATDNTTGNTTGDMLAEQIYTTTVEATDNATEIFDAIMQEGEDLASQTYSPTISATDNASGVVASVASALDALDGKTVTTTIKTVAQSVSSVAASLSSSIQGYATGLRYVPQDDFLARLHEGEAVLTKAEATLWRAGYAPQSNTGGEQAGTSDTSGSFQQINNFNVPVQTPDEFANTMKLYQTYGLDGVFS